MAKEDIIYTISDEKVERLKRRIILLENQNIKTHEKNDPEMIKQIKKLIEEEVNAVAIN